MNTLRVKRLQALIKDEKSLFVKRNKKANRSWSLIEAAAGRQGGRKRQKSAFHFGGQVQALYLARVLLIRVRDAVFNRDLYECNPNLKS
jgi:hypothetical protein